jgi:hypothetical protein
VQRKQAAPEELVLFLDPDVIKEYNTKDDY